MPMYNLGGVKLALASNIIEFYRDTEIRKAEKREVDIVYNFFSGLAIAAVMVCFWVSF